MPFDPDKYLRNEKSTFDPDKYLAGTEGDIEPIFSQEDINRNLTADIMAQEAGVDINTVEATYDTYVKRRFGSVISATKAKEELIKEGVLVVPEARNKDILALADSAMQATQAQVERKEISPETKRRLASNDLTSLTNLYISEFESTDSVLTEAIDALPESLEGKELRSFQGSIEDLIDPAHFMEAISDMDRASAMNLHKARKAAFYGQIEQYRNDTTGEINRDFSKQQTGLLSGLKKGAIKGGAGVAKGIAGLTSDIAGEFVPDVEGVRSFFGEVLDDPKLETGEGFGQFVGNTFGSTGVHMLSIMAGGTATKGTRLGVHLGRFLTSFASGREEAKTSALESGASAGMAEVEGEIVGGINAVIELFQIDSIFKFANTKAFKSAIKESIADKIIRNGVGFTAQAFKLSVTEGLEEASQDGVAIAVPAILRDDYPTTAEGTPDWWQMLNRMTDAYVGGAIAGVAFGGAGKIYNSTIKNRYTNDLTRALHVIDGFNYNHAKDIATRVTNRLTAGRGDFDLILQDEIENTIDHGEEGLGVDFYRKNFKKIKRGGIDLKKFATEAKLEIDKTIEVMSSRIEKISPDVFRAMQKHVFNIGTRNKTMINQVKPLLDLYEKMTDTDKRVWDLATQNANRSDIEAVIKKYNASEDYMTYRLVMDKLHSMMTDSDIDVGYADSFFPRAVKDLDGIREHLSPDQNDLFSRAVKKKMESVNGRELTAIENTELINSVLRGYGPRGLNLTPPDSTKQRKIVEMNADIEGFYYDWQTSLVKYIENANKAVATREMFMSLPGKASGDYVKARDLDGKVKRLLTSQRKIREGLTYKNLSESKKLDKISQLGERILGYQTEIDGLLSDNENLASLVGELDITKDKQKELIDLLQASLNTKGTGKWVSSAKKLGYISTLSQVTNMITQIGELGFSVLESPKHTLPSIAKALTGRNKITVGDIGVENMGAEFSDTELDKTVSFFLSGMETIDRIGKNVFVNTSVSKLRAMAKKNPDKLREEIKRFVPESEMDQTVEDLKNGVVSLNVQYLAFGKLSGIQPISILEMPERYAASPNLRIFYMLRSFSLKRLDFVRREALSLMKNPVSNPKDFAKGMARLTWMGAIFSLAEGSASVLKDLFRGKELDPPDYVVENLFKIMLLSKYDLRIAKQKGLGTAIAESVFTSFPTKTLDAATRDASNHIQGKGRKLELTRSIPFVGEAYYWWLGRGREKLEE